MPRKQSKSIRKSNRDGDFSWKRLDWLPAIYTLIILGGGVFAFIKTGSIPSLTASLVCSLFLTFGTYKTSINKRDHYFSSSKFVSFFYFSSFTFFVDKLFLVLFFELKSGVIFCIFLVMGYRYLTTHKAVPCFVATLSLSILVYLVGRAKDLVYERDVDE